MPPDPIPPGTDLVQPFRRSPPKTLALMAALAEGAQAASLARATHLAARLGIQGGRALKRFYRLWRTPRIDDQGLTAQRLRLLGARGCPLVRGGQPLQELVQPVVVRLVAVMAPP